MMFEDVVSIELKERPLKEQAAYWDGYNAACRNLKKQMLDKMEHYRGLLRMVINGHVPAKDCGIMITEELSRNPEWEVMEHMPHMIPMCQDPNAYKSVDEQ